MKLLIVKYLPSGAVSNTMRLLEHFKERIGGKYDLHELDLLQSPPPWLDESSLASFKRSGNNEILNPAQEKVFRPFIELSNQFVEADLVVLVTPMHNYALPGIVKTYFDAVMQKGKVVKYNNGKRIPLLEGKKFLTLYTSGGEYKGERAHKDNLRTMVDILLDFMGISEKQYVTASMGKEALRKVRLEEAYRAIDSVITLWKL